MCPIARPPSSPVEPVVDILHGVPVADPYRWLEEQNSPRTRTWIQEQTLYARAYLDGVPGRNQIRGRVRDHLDVETYDSFLKSGARYFFRKRLQGQEQPSIYFRESAEGDDQLLVDPAARGTGSYTALKPLRVSPDGSLLLYEVKQGGERTGTFEILDVANRRILPDSLSHGYLRGFAFAPDGKGFYYAHEPTQAAKSPKMALYHPLGTMFENDQNIFYAGEAKQIRLSIVPGRRCLGLLVNRFLDKTYTDFHLWRMGSLHAPVSILQNADHRFAPRFLQTRIVAVTDKDAPNRRIVELQPRRNQEPLLFNLVPERDAVIRDWLITQNHILVTYARGTATLIEIYDSFGKHLGQIPSDPNETVRVICGHSEDDEIFLERESFTQPIKIDRFAVPSGVRTNWAQFNSPIEPTHFAQATEHFRSKNGTSIPVSLFGRRDVLAGGVHPIVMTSYGGYGVPMTPRFSVFVSLLVDCGCLFALPNIRGGSEFGTEWHHAAKRRNRQVAFDDFVSAAEWLIATGRTIPRQLAIFGGSNSGLLVAAAMTQRPDLFRAVLCMVPMTDMVRYHLFDNAHVWKDEYGTADDAEDFQALLHYSPYHSVCDGAAYPSTMLVSGDADQNCNALHARKFTARLQAGNASQNPILLHYSPHRGHSPVLPLTERVEALTDRVTFLCEQLGLAV